MISDKTRAEMREIIARYPEPRSALLPMLHLVQSEEGHVSPEGIEVCAELLDITAAEVAAVATFYTMYKRRPVGDYHVGVCTNTLCAVMGGDAIFSSLKDHLGIGNDETTEDGSITLEHVECNAACDFAPVVMVNWEFFDNMTPQRARKLVDDLRAGVEVEADRGARVCTWRQAERVLAGFPDGRADEGPASGEASLVGLRLAHERGWSAVGGGEGTAPDLTTRPSTPAEATRAAEQSDTQRAHSESRAAEVGSGTGAGPDKRADAPEGKRPGGAASNGEGEKGQR
ncbi:NADH-quinone oxidoreductase subunit NuoE [Actinopolymorpha pittospori]|uniref:NADH-quinone oxidoreductase subunit E n=2 Tax=Actinopolymorpha pittospori TaxID=648752 RepID=A0A927MV94_9ACTN|nr:NADH-quinone oxidoreductase subunit E [Actinopolymorpha pittospori]